MENCSMFKDIKVTPEILDVLGEAALKSFTHDYLSHLRDDLLIEMLNFLGEVAIKSLSYEFDGGWPKEMIHEIAKHPKLPHAKLQDFLNNPPCNDAFWGALLNPQLSASELDKWAKKPIALADDGIGSPTGWALVSICRNANTSAETLKYIAERQDFILAMTIAHQVNKWPDHMQALCEALLENPKTPPEVVYFINRLYAAPYDWHDDTAEVGDAKNPLL